jgi:hypothetical protein
MFPIYLLLCLQVLSEMNALATDQKRDLRLSICQVCDYLRLENNRWFCSKCNCPELHIKTRYKLAQCPIGKW